jgi:hypothetical protein
MSNQTSVEWLKDCLSIHLTDEQKQQFEGLFQQALAMEKEQIVDAWNNGMKSDNGHFGTSKQYYNETFKGGQDA